MTRREKEYCEECELPKECIHCGDLMTWHDFFGTHWCQELYFGIALDKDIENLKKEGK